MESENQLAIGDYVAAVKRRRLLAVWLAVPIVVVGAVLAVALPNVYRSTATFRLVADQVTQSTNAAQDYSDEYVLGLAEKFFTTDAPQAILREADPYPDLKDDLDTALEQLHDDVTVAMVTQSVLEPGGGRERVVNTGFTVSYENREPDAAVKVATAITDAFVGLGRSDRLTVANNRVKFFNGEAERLAKEIATLEARLAQFKAANFDRLPEAAQANVTIRGRLEQDLSGVDREIRTLQQNRVFVVQQLRQAQAGPAAGNLQQLEDEYARKAAIYAETHPDMVALRRQIDNLRRGGTVATGNSLQAQIDSQKAILGEAQQRYSDDHPDIRRMVRNIEALEARKAAGESGASSGASDTLMSVQLQTQLNAIDTQIGGLQAQRGSLNARLSELESQLGATPEVEREYESITRGLGGAREQYNQMIGKRLDAEMEGAAISTGSADRFTLFSRPGKPFKPAGPPRLGILVVSLLLALMAALSAVAVAEMVDPSVRGSRDIRSLMGHPPLAAVPEIRNSVLARRRARRIAALGGFVVIATPVLFIIVRLLST